MPLLGGRLCEVAYTNPLIPLLTFFIPINWGGGGAWTLVPLSYASVSGAARICQRGAKAKRPSGGGCERFPPSHGREIFWNFMYENFIFLDIIMLLLGDRLCEVVYTNPLPPPFLHFFYFLH